jgi:hypothetical protein
MFASSACPAEPENKEVPYDKSVTLSSGVKMAGNVPSPQPYTYVLITSASSIKKCSF